MTEQKIKSDGGRSSYYDIPFSDDELKMISDINRFDYDVFIKNMFGDDPTFKKFIDILLEMHGFELPENTVHRICLNKEQVTRALTEGKLTLDDVFIPLFFNDFDYCTILKSLKRAYEDMNGRGKLGADAKYNFGKISYSLNQINKRTTAIRAHKQIDALFELHELEKLLTK